MFGTFPSLAKTANLLTWKLARVTLANPENVVWPRMILGISLITIQNDSGQLTVSWLPTISGKVVGRYFSIQGTFRPLPALLFSPSADICTQAESVKDQTGGVILLGNFSTKIQAWLNNWEQEDISVSKFLLSCPEQLKRWPCRSKVSNIAWHPERDLDSIRSSYDVFNEAWSCYFPNSSKSSTSDRSSA